MLIAATHNSLTFTKNKVDAKYLQLARDFIKHYNILDEARAEEIIRCGDYTKLPKYNRKKLEYRNIVLKSIKKNSLRYNDRRKLKIRLWPRFDENGEKMLDDNGVTLKVERYDIIAFVRLLVAAKELGNNTLYDFLSLYDVRHIMDNIIEDYFGDVRLFLSRESL